jgi:hypothetical protein
MDHQNRIDDSQWINVKKVLEILTIVDDIVKK